MFITLGVAAVLFGLYTDTQVWNAVMPSVFGLPKLDYLQVFIGSIALRFIFSQSYVTEILWSRHLQSLSEIEKKSEKLLKYGTYFTGQLILLFLIWGIMYVYDKT